MILMIDNYDSFTYNIVQYMGELGADMLVERNDQISIEEIEALNPKKIVISPGPCTPYKAGGLRCGDQTLCRKSSIAGCLSRASVGWGCFWGRNYQSRQTDAWKNL